MTHKSGPAVTHTSVMVSELLEHLNVRPGGRYIDCTVGVGGHAAAILQAGEPDCRLLGLDADPEALRIARERLTPFGACVTLVESYFSEVTQVAAEAGFLPADGLICDLGVSSVQLDRPERGFSFRAEGPLDMRFGPSAERTAADIVNSESQEELARILYEYGEERRSRRIARRIVERRPFSSTTQLAKAVEQVAGEGRQASRSRVHPATKTFLALRIAVNQELRHLETVLAEARDLLGFGSRLVVISFHSLEDRLVKRFLQDASRGDAPTFRLLTRKVVRPGPAEVQGNRRSRSARLRAAEAI